MKGKTQVDFITVKVNAKVYTIKPLEWKDYSDQSISKCGNFIVSEIIDGSFLLEDDNLNELASKDTLEEAKEAAQQIHEKNLIDNYLKEVK